MRISDWEFRRVLFRSTVSATPEAVDRLKNQEAVTLRETDDGKVEIAVTGRVDGELEKAIAATIPEPERQGFAEAVARYRIEVKDQLSPATQGEPLERKHGV